MVLFSAVRVKRCFDVQKKMTKLPERKRAFSFDVFPKSDHQHGPPHYPVPTQTNRQTEKEAKKNWQGFSFRHFNWISGEPAF